MAPTCTGLLVRRFRKGMGMSLRRAARLRDGLRQRGRVRRCLTRRPAAARKLLPGVFGFLVERIGGEFDQLHADAVGIPDI
jgi:hypothetical protein